MADRRNACWQNRHPPCFPPARHGHVLHVHGLPLAPMLAGPHAAGAVMLTTAGSVRMSQPACAMPASVTRTASPQVPRGSKAQPSKAWSSCGGGRWGAGLAHACACASTSAETAETAKNSSGGGSPSTAGCPVTPLTKSSPTPLKSRLGAAIHMPPPGWIPACAGVNILVVLAIGRLQLAASPAPPNPRRLHAGYRQKRLHTD